MKISKPPEERKNEILDVAEKLFISKGYSKTTVQDMLDEIGIAKGTFYYHFKSKEDVMMASVMRFIDNCKSKADIILKTESIPAIQKLAMVLSAWQPENNEVTGIYDELHNPENALMHSRQLVEVVKQCTPQLVCVLEQGISEGVFDCEYPKETIEQLLVASNLLLDPDSGFSDGTEDLLKRVIAFACNAELMTGAKKGSFSFIYEPFLGGQNE